MLHACRLVTGPVPWRGLSRPPPHRSPARPRHRRRLPGAHGPVQPYPGLAAAGLLAAVAGRGHSAGAAGTPPQTAQRPTVRLVPEGAAADVGDRTRRHRGRHRLVGRRAVQRPPRLEHPARLSAGAAQRGGAGLPRRPDRTALRDGLRLGDRPADGPAGKGLAVHQGQRLLRPDHSQAVRRQGLLRLRPLPGGDEAGHPQRRPGLHGDGAQLPGPGRTAAALRHRGPARPLPAAPGPRRGHSLLRPHRPAGRLRRRRHAGHRDRLQGPVERRGSHWPAPELGEALHHPRPGRHPARPGVQGP
ncbi:hypothetical protein D9M68_171640 [compost metagenome]